MREKFYIDAFEEYRKRLGAFCKFQCVELPEERLPEEPSDGEMKRALEKEAEAIRKAIPNNSYLFVTQFSVQGSGCCVPRIGINTKLWQVMLLCPLFIESHKSAAISSSGRLRRYDKRVQDTDGFRIELPGRTGINIHLNLVYNRRA